MSQIDTGFMPSYNLRESDAIDTFVTIGQTLGDIGRLLGCVVGSIGGSIGARALGEYAVDQLYEGE